MIDFVLVIYEHGYVSQDMLLFAIVLYIQ